MNPSHIRNIVIKPGSAGRPGTQPTRGLDRFGFVKRPVNALTMSNPVDPAGPPVTRARPSQDLGFFFSNEGFETHWYIYTLCSQEKIYVFSMWDKKLFCLSTST